MAIEPASGVRPQAEISSGPGRVAEGIRLWWSGLTLARQFLFAGGSVLVIGMVLIGAWVTEQIERNIIRNTAATTALYVDSFIAPILADVQANRTLPEGPRRALDETLSQGTLGERLASFKIWKEDGFISYSSRPELIGQRFEENDSLRRAWAGEVTAELDDLEEDESKIERTEGVPLLETYSPIREPWSGEVVAVAEFYEVATEIEESLAAARLKSWMVVAAVTLCMMGMLFGIVARGSRLIAGQREALEKRVGELSRLLAANEELRARVQSASSRTVALNERYLRRVSADLHDGPAQLLALASLKLESGDIADQASPQARIREYLDQAMMEIRDICHGLTLPQIERLGIADLVRVAVTSHEARSGTEVRVELPTDTLDFTHSQKICVFRFVQEGLNNAFRHAGGEAQSVVVRIDRKTVRVEVSDGGPGFDIDDRGQSRLGLAGLRERVESLGGSFELNSSSSGTKLTMSLPAGTHAEA